MITAGGAALTGPASPRSVYIAFEVFPRPKGASSHMAAMVTALARNYSPVLLICLGYADMPALQLEDDIIILRHKMHHPNLLRRSVGFGEFIRHCLSQLTRKPEIMVFRDPWSGWPALLSLPDTASVFEVNGLPSWELPYNYPQTKNNHALLAKIRDLELFCLGSVDGILTVSDLTSEALVDLGATRQNITLVPNSADPVFFEADGRETVLDILSVGRWFGYFGSLHSWQGVDCLVEAWSRLHGEFPETRMLVVHSGRRGPLKLLKKLIKKKDLFSRIFLQSPLETRKIAQVTARMEFTCAPLTETFRNTVQGCCPLKIVESMAAGTPVLASRLRVSQALIREEKDGILARPGDVRNWALALRRLLQDERLRRELGLEAKRQAGLRFTRQIMFDQLDRAFSAAVEQAARRS